MNQMVGRFSISHGVNLVLGNVVLRRSFWRPPGRSLGRLILALRPGLGATVPHPETMILGVADEHYQTGRPAIQIAAGAEFRLWRGVYALGEYKFTRTRQHVRVPGGTAEILLQSHHGVAGLAFHF